MKSYLEIKVPVTMKYSPKAVKLQSDIISEQTQIIKERYQFSHGKKNKKKGRKK